VLADLVLAAIIAAVVSFIALFARRARPDRRAGSTAGRWPAIRRFVLALLGTLVLAALVVAVLWLYGAGRGSQLAAAAAVAGASLVWLPVTRRWTAGAHLCWASTTLLLVAYLVFILDWTFASRLGPANTAAGVLLWLLELFAAGLACAYLWELCDALGTENWRRRITADTPAPELPDPPMVSLHVPAHNEPPEMVIATLESLLRIDYPRYEIIAIDDNTDDEALWRPVEEWCSRNEVKFAHLTEWPGYKSGALNYALGELTDPAAEVIGVVDSDYQIDPGFLGRCAPLFADSKVAFIQAPQDYRDWRHAPFYRRLYYSYKYFFAVSQPSRNERDGAIFAGTMGLIRRSALVAVGGWDEWCITEDAELSMRLLRAGWSGLHVDQSWGYGVMPLTFEALKSQRFRWCFGGIQILRMHWRSMLPGRRTEHNKLDLGQRWAYLSGALQWYGDLLGTIFFVFLLIGAANLASGGDQLFRKLTAFLVAAVPALVALGLLRAVALLRRGTGASWRDALGAFLIWQSTSLVVARASVQGLFARRAEFLRTPKTSGTGKWWEALRGNWAECLLALLGTAAIVAALTRLDTYSGPLLAVLLLFPTIGFAAAPANSLAAQRAALPPELGARRRTEWLRDRRSLAVQGAAFGGTGVALAAVAVLLALLGVPSPAPVHPPALRPPGGTGGQGGGGPVPTPTGPAPSPSSGPGTGSTGPSPAPSPTVGGGSSSGGSGPSGGSGGPAVTGGTG
jgi:cellulose synthase/poly-beta-1,6-N-acetylglucosamine synthase-like glycosyltransferase